MPGPIQSGISSLIGTAQVGGVVSKHFKEQKKAAEAEAAQAAAQNAQLEEQSKSLKNVEDINKHGEEERTAAVKKTEEEKVRLAKEAREEEIAKDRQSELAALEKEARGLEPTESGRRAAERAAHQNAALPESYDEYRRILDALGPDVGMKYLYARLAGNKDVMDRLRPYATKQYYNNPQYQFRTSNDYYARREEIGKQASDAYYKRAMGRVRDFTESESYKLRMMYAKGEIGSRQELTERLGKAEMADAETRTRRHLEQWVNKGGIN